MNRLGLIRIGHSVRPLVVTTLFLLAASESAAQTATLPGPAPNRALPRDAARENQRCTTCHRTIAEEWNRSLHRHAYDNPYFARAVKIEAVNFCRKCHAADASPDRDPEPALAANGVSCLTCHFTERGVTGAHGTGTRSVAGHDAAGDARWSDDRACGNCHQFEFPAKPGASERTPMQDTVHEHSLSQYAGAPCQRCHMQLVKDADGASHHRHDFSVQADPSMLARAVNLELVSRTDKQVTLALSAGAIGHAFPTGDLFRSAELELWEASGNAQRRKPVVVRLARDYTQDTPNQSRRVVSDTRLKPTANGRDTRLVTIDLVTKGTPIAYRLTWIRMPPRLAKLFQLEPSKNVRVVLEGKL
jgi:hypothetical protein